MTANPAAPDSRLAWLWRLETLSYAYLLLPTFVFFFGWLLPSVALTAAAVVAAGVVCALRGQARTNKDWAQSDEPRKQISELGAEVKDAPTGSTWRPRLALGSMRWILASVR